MKFILKNIEDIIEEDVDVKYESTFDNYNIKKDDDNQGNNQKKFLNQKVIIKF